MKMGNRTFSLSKTCFPGSLVALITAALVQPGPTLSPSFSAHLYARLIVCLSVTLLGLGSIDFAKTRESV
jgi:hypothetical protein